MRSLDPSERGRPREVAFPRARMTIADTFAPEQVNMRISAAITTPDHMESVAITVGSAGNVVDEFGNQVLLRPRRQPPWHRDGQLLAHGPILPLEPVRGLEESWRIIVAPIREVADIASLQILANPETLEAEDVHRPLPSLALPNRLHAQMKEL